MAENNSLPPLMTDKELLMECSAYSKIMAAAFEYADAYCSSGDEHRRYKAAIDNLRKTVRAEIARFSRGNYKAPQPQVEPAGGVSNEDVQDLVSLALRKAWQLGQTYWQQADSEFISQQNKSDATQAKFQVLIDETRAALATTQPAAAVNQQLTADQQTGGIKSDEDCILVPRGLLGAACSALARHGESPKTLHELRRYTVGDLSKAQPAPVGEYPALPKALDCFYDEIDKEEVNVYSDYQMRAYADATHAMRAGEQEPVGYLYHDAPTLQDLIANERNGIPVNSWRFSIARLPHMRNETTLYTSPVATQGEQLDAKRYRGIRHLVYGENIEIGEALLMLKVVGVCPTPAEFDQGIDAALSATTPPTKPKE